MQTELFNKLIPETDFETSPANNELASASDRFRAASEIFHVRVKEYEPRILSLISKMPRGPEQIRSIQKLSPVFDNFFGETQLRFWKIAKTYISTRDNNYDDSVQAQKFFTIVRDHADEPSQKNHEKFSRQYPEFSKTATQELIKEFSRDIRERNPIDDRLSRGDFPTIIDDVERGFGDLSASTELTKEQVHKLRGDAYKLRRVAERIGYEGFYPAKTAYNPSDIVSDNGTGPKSRSNATTSRQMLRDADRGRSDCGR